MIDENLFAWIVKDKFGEIAKFIFHADAKIFLEHAMQREPARYLTIDSKLLKKDNNMSTK